MFNPHLFQVFLRPSFGACAPPSPDLTFYAYIFSAEWEDFLFFDSAFDLKRSEVFPLDGLYVSFYLIWGKCRRRETLLSIEIQYGKEGILKN